MKNIINLLSDPLQGLDKNTSTAKDVNERFYKIAVELFNNYCIKCGDEELYFAEVEFYYFESRKWNKNWKNENRIEYSDDWIVENESCFAKE